MLVLSTPYQRNVLSKYLSEKALIDSTHGTNRYDFQLTTLMSVDDCAAGVPVVYCISNRTNADHMGTFFNALKKAVGRIKTKVLISDMAMFYYNAWKHVMAEADHQLVSSWHVVEAWKANVIAKVNGVNKSAEVYRALRVLNSIMDFELFLVCLLGMPEMLKADEDTKEFGEYFEAEYTRHPEPRAFCYRVGLGIDTNMFLEAMQKKLKYTYMKGKQIRREDECIGILMTFTRDVAFQRLTRKCKGNDSSRQSVIKDRHRTSVKEITESMVSVVKPGCSWCVKSSTSLVNHQYDVTRDLGNECLGCELSCMACHICVHMYKSDPAVGQEDP